MSSSGTTTADATGHGITGTLVNGATFTTAGKYGNALALDGVNDYVDLGNPGALQLTGSMTVSAWINATAFPSDDAAVVSDRNSGNLGFQLDTTVDTGRRTIGFKLTNSSGGDMIRYGATTLQTNTWYHIAGVYDAAAQTLHVYLNGQLDDGQLLGTVTATQQPSTLDVEIGQRPGNPGAFQFNGRIDDVRIADHAITQSQIQTSMAMPIDSSSGFGNWSYTTPALLDGSHSFTAKATDNAGNTTTTSAVTATVNTGTVDTTPPVLGNVAASASYASLGPPRTLSPSATVSDVDNLNLASGTVSITGGILTGDTLAASTSGTSITASYNASIGVLSLTGSDTLAHYQQVLDSVSYSSSSQDPTNSGADPNRTISWVVNDGTLNSPTQTTTVNITASDAPPVLGNVAASASYTELASPTTLSAGTTVSDVDSPNLASGTVSITSGFLTGDTLAATVTGTSITASYNASTGVLSLTGSDTLAHYQQVLDSIAYSSTSHNPTNFGANASRTISWVVNDGTLNSAPQTTTVNITAVDDPPALGNVAASASYASLGPPTTLSPSATVRDVDNLNLASGTVSITGGILTGDTLAASTSGTSITASYNASTGVLSLTGSDTLAHYQQVLDSVSYSSSSQDPTNSGADPNRTISWVVNDGTLNSTTQTTTLTIGAAPTGIGFTLPTSFANIENGSGHLNGTNLGTFTQTGGAAGDSFTYSGSATGGGGTISVSSGGVLSASNVNGLSGGRVIPLNVTVKDTTNNTQKTVTYDIVVGTNGNNSIAVPNVASIVFGLSTGSNGTDTISAVANTAPVWIVDGGNNLSMGGSGAHSVLTGGSGSDVLIGGAGDKSDTLTGGGGADSLTGGSNVPINFVYKAVSDSTVLSPDTITNFIGSDVIDTLTLTGITAYQGQITGSAQVAAHSIAWLQSGGNTIVYANATGSAENQGSADMAIVLTGTLTLSSVNFHHAPAGVSGQAINLALPDAPGGQTNLVTVTIGGVPSGWSLNGWTKLGDDTWMIQSSNPTTLTVTPSGTFSGAMLLGVTESWSNRDGTVGSAFFGDNIEAYAPGAPVFALSSNDTLSGGSGNDLFVFAQPIGNDTIYNFNIRSDQIDLIGFNGITSFADIQSKLTKDADGNAVIAVGTGETITIRGVDSGLLSATNFLFDQEPTTNNAGSMTIGDDAILPLGGRVNNTGTIALNSTGDETDLEVLIGGATLQGGGRLILSDNSRNVVFGGDTSAVLTNIDNTISGAGRLGNGQMTLVNRGVIEATGTSPLVVDTGLNVVTNTGTIEATGSGGLVIRSAVANSGVLWADGGNLTVEAAVSGGGNAKIAGAAILEFGVGSDAATTFVAGATGTLRLDHSARFTGTVSGFAPGDMFDLADIGFGGNTSLAYIANAAGTGGTLTVGDGVHSASLVVARAIRGGRVHGSGRPWERHRRHLCAAERRYPPDTVDKS